MAKSTRSWAEICEPWINKEDGSLYQRTCVAPAPSKDFLQIFITVDQIIFRIWRILPPTRADANQHPVEMKSNYTDFPDDDRMRGEIVRNLGEKELNYIDALIGGHIDYLNRLSRKVLLRIIFNLDLTSILKLSQVSKMFRELGSCDAVWSKIYMDHTTQPITHELLMLTDQQGWKEVFFMNRIQLQKFLHRQQEKTSKSNKKR
ncbi:F-box only protein 36-like isoform X2 [Biomphalaria glabrata]|uniref:F-box only protein 36-like isoform X2 n=1 Tax=Biomphalaria glabrata TaxID=6526 RepID=A0A9U8DZR5_BIOGL|nr:F-box only protein 36-like isoform X2 [Biomphalaria glabrata]